MRLSFLEHTYMCPSPVQSAASLLPPPAMDPWWLAVLWWLPLVSWWLWALLASLWVLVLWVFWWVSGLLAFLWASGLSVSLLWLPSLLLSLPWLQKNRFKREKNSYFKPCNAWEAIKHTAALLGCWTFTASVGLIFFFFYSLLVSIHVFVETTWNWQSLM